MSGGHKCGEYFGRELTAGVQGLELQWYENISQERAIFIDS